MYIRNNNIIIHSAYTNISTYTINGSLKVLEFHSIKTDKYGSIFLSKPSG